MHGHEHEVFLQHKDTTIRNHSGHYDNSVDNDGNTSQRGRSVSACFMVYVQAAYVLYAKHTDQWPYREQYREAREDVTAGWDREREGEREREREKKKRKESEF